MSTLRACTCVETPPATLPLEAYPQRDTQPAAQLNAPFTLEEIQQGLKALNNCKACGASGIPAEMLRYAKAEADNNNPKPAHVLAPVLLEVLNCAFAKGEVPASSNVAHLTPVFKRGDPNEPQSYRPIVVGEPLLRLYAVILNRRLTQYLEVNNLRSDAQAGFRPGRSTVHQLFALQHFIDAANARGERLLLLPGPQ